MTIRAADGKRIYEELSHLLNGSCGEGVKAFVEGAVYDHRTLQQDFMREVVLPWLKAKAEDYENQRYDLRNEGTCHMAAVMMTAIAEAEDKGEKIYLPYV